MSLQIALDNALTGMRVNREQISTISNNIANANTDGYSRKIVDQTAQFIDGTGVGVQIASITRRIDLYLQRSIVAQNSNVSQADTLNTFADRLQVLLGKPGASNSIDAYITNFFSGLQNLSQSPENNSLRTTAVQAGISLAQQISSLAGGVQDLRYQADTEISQSINDVNRSLKSLRDVNTALAASFASGRSQADLLDQRDQLINTISKNINVNTFTRENGTVNLYAPGGTTLLDESGLYNLSYNNIPSSSTLIGGGSLSALQIYRVDDVTGKLIGQPTTLMPGGVSGTQTNVISSGKLKALTDLRDTELPKIVDQLDMLASRMRDGFNAIHNQGSGYPAAASYTGTRAVTADAYGQWSGSVRIGLTDPLGRPVASPYADETGLRPLTIDLSKLNAGQGAGAGWPDTQSIINEINSYYGTPQNKVELGNLNNIRLASDTKAIPNNNNLFSFDFDLDNASATNGKFFLTGVQVLDDTNTDITSVTQTIPQINLAAVNTFQTTAAVPTVTVNTAAAHGLVDGQTIYLANPGGTVGGLAGASVAGFYTVSNVTSTSFTIDLNPPPIATGNDSLPGAQVLPPYATATPGDATRTNTNGVITADLAANNASSFYTIKATVGVQDADGNIKTSTISYKVTNNVAGNFNKRYSAAAATGNANLVQPQRTTPYLVASLVDANGAEIAKNADGTYKSGVEGFLKVASYDGSTSVAIDSLDSTQLGFFNDVPSQPGTNRGFSHYFELNNFFKSNDPTSTGDTVAGSALNMAVEDRFTRNPALLSTGTLTLSNQSSDPSVPPVYTYERNIGDNSVIAQLVNLNTSLNSFDGAGGLAATSKSFTAYAADILGFTATQATNYSSQLSSSQTLLDGYTQRASAIGGVDMNEEIANITLYQNAFTASARIITVTNKLYDDLLGAFT